MKIFSYFETSNRGATKIFSNFESEFERNHIPLLPRGCTPQSFKGIFFLQHGEEAGKTLVHKIIGSGQLLVRCKTNQVRSF